MRISYRSRRAFRRLLVTVGILMLIGIIVWLCWFIWLERYIIYDRDGASLDFDLPPLQGGEIVVTPTAGETVPIFYNEGNNSVTLSTELTRIAGYYIDAAALSQDISVVRSQIAALPGDTPIMLDIKNPQGAFFYSSSVGAARSSSVDIGAVDSLIQDLVKSNRYLIARLPALQDREFGLNHVDSGLFLPSGIGLWLDDTGCYWLNPTAGGTITYLMQIIGELKGLGFDEVVLSEFRFPDSDGYVFNGEKSEALASSAKSLVSNCTTDSFAVSFVSNQTDFPLPEGRSRLYLSDIPAIRADKSAAAVKAADPMIHVVFLAASNDTRYDTYSVMRPLDLAH